MPDGEGVARDVTRDPVPVAHRSRSAPGTMPRTSLNQRSGEVGSVRSGRTTALLRRVLRQITSDGAGSPESIIDAGEQLGLVLDKPG